MAVPWDRDYFTVPEDDIINIDSDLTLVGGKIVWRKVQLCIAFSGTAG